MFGGGRKGPEKAGRHLEWEGGGERKRKQMVREGEVGREEVGREEVGREKVGREEVGREEVGRRYVPQFAP